MCFLSFGQARDLAQVGVRVVTVAPGIFNTPMMQAVPQKVVDNLLSSVVSPKRLAEPQEFAQVVCGIIDNNYLNATGGLLLSIDAGVMVTFAFKGM